MEIISIWCQVDLAIGGTLFALGLFAGILWALFDALTDKDDD